MADESTRKYWREAQRRHRAGLTKTKTKEAQPIDYFNLGVGRKK